MSLRPLDEVANPVRGTDRLTHLLAMKANHSYNLADHKMCSQEHVFKVARDRASRERSLNPVQSFWVHVVMYAMELIAGDLGKNESCRMELEKIIVLANKMVGSAGFPMAATIRNSPGDVL